MRAKTYLRGVCGLTARSMTILKYSEHGITRDGEILRSSDIVYMGDTITLSLPEDTNDITPVEGTLDIIYEDDYLLVVNKPAHMPVHPTKIHQEDTLANIVSYYQHDIGESYAFRALYRLDKDTSGCVIIAKDRLTYALVQPTISKTYIAVCEGYTGERGVINNCISLEQGSKIRRCVSDNGQRAVTHYRALDRSEKHTLLELRLDTGRTHQIRCHMSSIGHPLAGDDLYGGSLQFIDRQALHCNSVEFSHPYTHERISLSVPVPVEFIDIIHKDT